VGGFAATAGSTGHRASGRESPSGESPDAPKNVEMGQNPPRKLKPGAGLQDIRGFLRLM